MTLKEELSLSRKNAIEEQAKLDAQADEEMRKMIPTYIEPILRIMHKNHPFEKTLSVRVENRGSIFFKPMLSAETGRHREYTEYYSSKLYAHQLLPASLRVGSEFDLDVQVDSENKKSYIFTMTLDD